MIGELAPQMVVGADPDLRDPADVPASAPVAGHHQVRALLVEAVAVHVDPEDGGGVAELGVDLAPRQYGVVAVAAGCRDQEAQPVLALERVEAGLRGPGDVEEQRAGEGVLAQARGASSHLRWLIVVFLCCCGVSRARPIRTRPKAGCVGRMESWTSTRSPRSWPVMRGHSIAAASSC
ncbi:hypothetical protein ACFSKW_12680 [Nonomuraea mangrovi]|uniref:Uncharacterized protein n=1 Tax=Nonomuraea mangrovi TaxID=2316207 RepID=A0ABW4SRW7_9ACTN